MEKKKPGRKPNPNKVAVVDKNAIVLGAEDSISNYELNELMDALPQVGMGAIPIDVVPNFEPEEAEPVVNSTPEGLGEPMTAGSTEAIIAAATSHVEEAVNDVVDNDKPCCHDMCPFFYSYESTSRFGDTVKKHGIINLPLSMPREESLLILEEAIQEKGQLHILAFNPC